jgi:RimJ/RimL family protein N-acetyltransferase
MKNLPLIQTERTLLRPMVESDASVIVDWRNDPENLSLMEKRDKITVESHLEWYRQRPENRLDYMVETIDESIPVGTLNLVVTEENSAISGRLFGNKELRRLGYAYEASVAWFRFAFRELNIHVIQSRTRVENIANINLNFKLGYKIKEMESGSTGTYYRMELKKENFPENE